MPNEQAPLLKGNGLSRLRQGVDLFGSACFLVLFLTILLQVFSRYLLDDPIGWTAEICVIAYLWLAFWGGGLMAGRQDHVRFDLVYSHLPSGMRRVMVFSRSMIIAGILLVALPANYDYIKFMEYDTTGVLEIGFDIVFSVFIFFMLALLVRYLRRATLLLGKEWRNEL